MGSAWHLGVRLQVVTNAQRTVHSLTTTDPAQADVIQMLRLMHWEEPVLYEDRVYRSQNVWRFCDATVRRYRVQRRAVRGRPLSAHWEAINQSRSRAHYGAITPSMW